VLTKTLRRKVVEKLRAHGLGGYVHLTEELDREVLELMLSRKVSAEQLEAYVRLIAFYGSAQNVVDAAVRVFVNALQPIVRVFQECTKVLAAPGRNR
jgi:hypothetical protein